MQKSLVNRYVLICNTCTLSLVLYMNVLILQFTCMFLLTSVLKELYGNYSSSSMKTNWIVVKTSNLTMFPELLNDILLINL